MTAITLVATGPAVPRSTGRRVLPGFGLTLGYTVIYLSLVVLIPLTALVAKTLTLGWTEFSD